MKASIRNIVLPPTPVPTRPQTINGWSRVNDRMVRTGTNIIPPTFKTVEKRPKYAPKVKWTQERLETLARMTNDGMTLAEMAEYFGDVTEHGVRRQITRLRAEGILEGGKRSVGRPRKEGK